MFQGDLRTNLDPLGTHSDDDLWKVLNAVRRIVGSVTTATLHVAVLPIPLVHCE